MRILQTGDWHLGVTTHGQLNPRTGLNTRTQRLAEAVKWVGDVALDASVDAVVLTGDLFDKRTVSGAEVSILSEFLRRMEHNRIPVVGVVGNHDQEWHWRRSSVPHSLCPLIEDSIRSVELDCATFCLIPYPNRASIAAAGWTHEDMSKAVTDFVMVDKLQTVDDLPFIVVGHMSVTSASYSPEQNPLLMGVGDCMVSAEALCQDGVTAVMLGHIHQPQQRSGYAYAGSLDRLSFGEAGHKVGVMVHSIEGIGYQDTSTMFIDNPHPTEFATVVLDVGAELGNFGDISPGTIIRIVSMVRLEPAQKTRIAKLARDEGMYLATITEPPVEHVMRDNAAFVAEAVTDEEMCRRWAQARDAEAEPLLELLREVDADALETDATA